MNHTPGPWRAAIREHKGVEYANILAENDVAVAKTYFNSRNGQTNARLIAEAPELYTELNMIMDAWELIEAGQVPGRALTPWEQERLRFVRDLLDKIDHK